MVYHQANAHKKRIAVITRVITSVLLSVDRETHSDVHRRVQVIFVEGQARLDRRRWILFPLQPSTSQKLRSRVQVLR